MASGSTPIQGFPYPVPLDGVNVEGDMKALATALDNKGVMPFASVTERSQKLPTPGDGAVSFLRDVRRFDWWDGQADTWKRLAGSGPSFLQLHVPALVVNHDVSNPPAVTGWQVEANTSPYVVNANGLITIPDAGVISAMAKFVSIGGDQGLSAVALWFSNLNRGPEDTVARVGGPSQGLLRQSVTFPSVYVPAGTAVFCTVYQDNVAGAALQYEVTLQISGVG